LVGPRNPLEPIGECLVLGTYVRAQRYEDGIIYEVQLPHGSPLAAFFASTNRIPEEHVSRAVWSTTLHEDGYLFFTLWVAND
jgi:hypothetical protein